MNEDTELSELDAPPANGLDSIFVLPAHIADDERIRAWYDEMATQLRREAQGIPMKAAQYTLMERICFFYANMRYQEFNNPELSDRQRQANVDTWQKMVDQFNRLLEKHNDKVIAEMTITVMDILKERLGMITDPIERSALRRALAEDLAKVGM